MRVRTSMRGSIAWSSFAWGWRSSLGRVSGRCRTGEGLLLLLLLMSHGLLLMKQLVRHLLFIYLL